MGRILREKQSRDVVVIRKAESGIGGVSTKKGGEGRGPPSSMLDSSMARMKRSLLLGEVQRLRRQLSSDNFTLKRCKASRADGKK